MYLSLPKRLRAARDEANLGTTQLSLAAGLSRATVGSVEAGGVARLDTIEAIAKALRVSPCWLAYNVEAPPILGDVLTCAGVGERLLQAREARGLSQRGLGRAANVTHNMIGYIEGGTIPSVAIVESLARALHVDPCWLAWAQGAAPPLE